MKNQRIDWIDMAKGYGIILMVFAHFYSRGYGIIWIYSFHMPLFFFLSGYVFKWQMSFDKFLWKKIKSLVIPYFMLGVVLAISKFLPYIGELELSIPSIKGIVKELIVQRRAWSIWFLAALFCLEILMFFIMCCIKNDLLRLITVVLISICGFIYCRKKLPPLPWNMDVCLVAILFFYCGYLAKKKNIIDSMCSIEKKYIILAIAGLFIIDAVFTKLNLSITKNGLQMYNSRYGLELLTIPAAFCGIFFIILVSNLKSINIIQYIGRYSLIIMGWHQDIVGPIVGIIIYKLIFGGYTELNSGPEFLLVIIRTAVTIIVLIVINEIIVFFKKMIIDYNLKNRFSKSNI